MDVETPQIKASLLIWFDAIAVQRDRLVSDIQGQGRRARFESIFLLEAFAICLRWLDRAVEKSIVDEQALANVEQHRKSIVDLRNMNIHQDEYVRGQGHSQARFKTGDPFQHHADSLQVASGRLILGGRLDALLCASQFEELEKQLRDAGVLPGR